MQPNESSTTQPFRTSFIKRFNINTHKKRLIRSSCDCFDNLLCAGPKTIELIKSATISAHKEGRIVDSNRSYETYPHIELDQNIV